MLRDIGGVVGGVITWFLIATVGNRVLHVAWPGYFEAKVAKTFTLGMLILRLFLGAISSFCTALSPHGSPTAACLRSNPSLACWL